MSQFKQYLRESIQQEAYRALNEQAVGGWRSLGPGGGTEGQVAAAPQAYTSKTSIGNRYPKSGKSPDKPLSAKAYMENLYGPMWRWIMGLLSQIFGPDWFNQFQNIIHDGSWTWPGWTPHRNGTYTLDFGDQHWSVQFVNGSWMFSLTQA